MTDQHQNRNRPAAADYNDEANQQKQHNQVTTQILVTVTAGVLFSASVVGMSGGFTSDAGLVLAEVVHGR